MIWDSGSPFVGKNALNVSIIRLREKLGTYHDKPYIETVRRVVHRWAEKPSFDMENVYIFIIMLLLAACVTLAIRLPRVRSETRCLTEQIDYFPLYTTEPIGESLAEGDITNLYNLVSRPEQLTLIRHQDAERREVGMTRFIENMAHQMKNSLTALQDTA